MNLHLDGPFTALTAFVIRFSSHLETVSVPLVVAEDRVVAHGVAVTRMIPHLWVNLSVLKQGNLKLLY